MLMVLDYKKMKRCETPKSFIKLCVVGDLMKDFSSHKNVITISELEKLIKSNPSDFDTEKYDIQVGQGICENRLKNLHSHISKSGLSDLFQINIPKLYKKSGRCLTHKNKDKNIMISEPIQVDNNAYESLLMLEDDCAEMSDHVTGRHIQGMVLVEAARQMVIAVTEKYYISTDRKGKLNFVTHSMDTLFHQFIFPLSVSIKYHIIELKEASNNNLSSKAIISFVQNGIVAAEVIFKFSVLDSVFIVEKESYLADKCIQKHFSISEAQNL